MTEHDRAADATPEVPTAPESAPPAASAEPVVAAQPAEAEHPQEPARDHAAAPAAVTDAAPQPERVVYVPAPQPPRKRGSRGFGVGVALASSLVFTILYGALAALFIGIGGPTALAERVQVFATTPSFWMPVIAFTVAYVVLVLITNRAGWWAHVLGGFVVAALVYLVFLASTVLSAEATGASPAQLQQFLLLQVTNPLGWAAAIAAREVPIWVGGLVARHGRRAKAHNAEARAAYERELAEARGTVPSVAPAV
ncbi:hypothetical protein [Microcella alkalica]|uniref:hypothetical protein n=1 Tax=Microcella alkalica TaxID=355930 RepID=UPI00145D1DBA|nr:hypothetical protein [Microcella alkalica]